MERELARCFVITAAVQLQFAHAAESLSLPRWVPVASVKKLEGDLGYPLFDTAVHAISTPLGGKAKVSERKGRAPTVTGAPRVGKRRQPHGWFTYIPFSKDVFTPAPLNTLEISGLVVGAAGFFCLGCGATGAIIRKMLSPNTSAGKTTRAYHRTPLPTRLRVSQKCTICHVHGPTLMRRSQTWVMGIRYYAYPITADEYPRALESPCPFHGADPLMDAWGSVDTKPEMLYLDKCWREFQALLGPLPGMRPRPAFLLVEGQVTNTNTGWIPFERARSPEQVKAIAADLATVGEQHIHEPLSDPYNIHLSRPEEYEYVAHYLADAKEFTARLAEQGRGLVYLIG